MICFTELWVTKSSSCWYCRCWRMQLSCLVLQDWPPTTLGLPATWGHWTPAPSRRCSAATWCHHKHPSDSRGSSIPLSYWNAPQMIKNSRVKNFMFLKFSLNEPNYQSKTITKSATASTGRTINRSMCHRSSSCDMPLCLRKCPYHKYKTLKRKPELSSHQQGIYREVEIYLKLIFFN